MKILLSIGLLLYSFISFGQTRLINHKSHSGKSTDFLKTHLTSISNFGMAPQRMVRNSKLDSLILIDEKTVIMITSESCHFEEYDGSDKSVSKLWKAGRDTVIEHDVFNGKNSTEEIRKIIKQKYFFANPADSIVFIGFDEPKQQELPKQASPKIHPKKKRKTEEEDRSSDQKRPSYITIILFSIISLMTRGTIMPH